MLPQKILYAVAKNNMDIKTLSACWATYQQPQSWTSIAYINGGMLSEYALEIEQGLGNKVQEKSAKAAQKLLTDFKLIHAA